MGSLFFGRRCRHVPPLAGVMASALVITSCGSQSSQSGSLAKAVNGIPVGLAQTVNPSAYQVSFTSKTVDVDRATVAANLISVSPDGTYTFSGDSGALGQLAAGKTMLLEGTDVEDVTKVSHSGSHLVVETTPASLTDLITNGHIADLAIVWAQTPDGMRGFLVERGARLLQHRARHARPSGGPVLHAPHRHRRPPRRDVGRGA